MDRDVKSYDYIEDASDIDIGNVSLYNCTIYFRGTNDPLIPSADGSFDLNLNRYAIMPIEDYKGMLERLTQREE